MVLFWVIVFHVVVVPAAWLAGNEVSGPILCPTSAGAISGDILSCGCPGSVCCSSSTGSVSTVGVLCGNVRSFYKVCLNSMTCEEVYTSLGKLCHHHLFMLHGSVAIHISIHACPGTNLWLSPWFWMLNWGGQFRLFWLWSLTIWLTIWLCLVMLHTFTDFQCTHCHIIFCCWPLISIRRTRSRSSSHPLLMIPM